MSPTGIPTGEWSSCNGDLRFVPFCRLIVLDIDGVLNNQNTTTTMQDELGVSWVGIDPFLVNVFNKIVDSPDPRPLFILLSSTWRTVPSIFAQLTQRGLRGVFIGKTGPDQDHRGLEIVDALRGNLEGFSLVVIDDDKDILDIPDFVGYTVRTDRKVGLTEKDTQRAIAILQKPFTRKTKS